MCAVALIGTADVMTAKVVGYRGGGPPRLRSNQHGAQDVAASVGKAKGGVAAGVAEPGQEATAVAILTVRKRGSFQAWLGSWTQTPKAFLVRVLVQW